ncbi:hypothetical protein [Tunturiibacter gelidiferens]|uniref:hypothetical protein n=1 Tax=Tunturiibacter gelidiferens TaxID=3069689 RepID=UPI003D9BEAF8
MQTQTVTFLVAGISGAVSLAMLTPIATECCHLRRLPKGVQNLIHAEGVRWRSRSSIRTWSESGDGE